MADKCASLDVRIAKIAARQHGVVSHRQLAALGMSRDAISARARRGALHRLHHGVYAVGHRAPQQEREWMAAVLACGKGAALSHGSAAALWGLLRPISGPIDVTVPTQSGRRRRRGIRLHRCGSLRSDQVISHLDISVTTPARTIADIEGTLPPWLVRRAIRQAEVAGMRLDSGTETDRTRSDLEWDFLELSRARASPPRR